MILILSIALASMPSPDGYSDAPPSLHSSIPPLSDTCVDAAGNPLVDAAVAGTPCAASLVYVPSGGASADASLFVYIPGSGNEPRDHDLLLKTAAYAGYPTIGISYDNVDTIGSVCEGVLTGLPLPCGVECPGKVRAERLLGVDASAFDDVFWKDAMVPRLWRVLDLLHADHPTEGWDAYFNPNKAQVIPRPIDINWDRIVVAGFSQGAGHALRIAQEFQVDGVALSDGGSDQCTDPNGDQVAANWYTPGGGASSGEPHYAAFHARDGDFHVPPALDVVGFTRGDSVDAWLWTLGDYEIFTTNQVHPSATPAGVDCSAHKSLARDGCIPSAPLPFEPQNAGSTVSAMWPPSMYLWEPYLEAFWLAGQ